MDGSPRRDRLVAAIGVFKLMKAAVLGPLGVAVLLGVRETIVQSVALWLRWTGALSGHHLVRMALARLLSLDNHDLREIGAAFIAYAAVFVVEGVGLLRRRRWAEWLTVIVTASFIPFEIYELARRPGAAKVFAIALNAAIVAYLAWRRARTHDGARLRTFGPPDDNVAHGYGAAKDAARDRRHHHRDRRGIVLVRRRNPPLGWALPGGFVDPGESVAQAARREAKEETGLDVELTELLGVYSDPKRDPRGLFTVSTVFIGRADGRPVGGDDAAEARVVSLDALPSGHRRSTTRR